MHFKENDLPGLFGTEGEKCGENEAEIPAEYC